MPGRSLNVDEILRSWNLTKDQWTEIEGKSSAYGGQQRTCLVGCLGLNACYVAICLPSCLTSPSVWSWCLSFQEKNICINQPLKSFRWANLQTNEDPIFPF